MREKKILLVIMALASVVFEGCSGGFYSAPLAVDVKLASPILQLNNEVPVVFPSEISRKKGSRIGRFVEERYPEYQFN